jgi:hypothetical protein
VVVQSKLQGIAQPSSQRVDMPCQSHCAHFNLHRESDGDMYAQISCGGVGVKRKIDNAEAKEA